MKVVVTFLTSLALALSMTAFAPSAQAAPYAGTVATKTTASVPKVIKRNRLVPVTYRVRANGNARPVGQVRIRISKVRANGKLALVRTVLRDVSTARTARANLNPLKVGRYRVKVSFKPRGGTVFKASSAPSRPFRVRR